VTCAFCHHLRTAVIIKIFRPTEVYTDLPCSEYVSKSDAFVVLASSEVGVEALSAGFGCLIFLSA
jgi:hypothetical protein